MRGLCCCLYALLTAGDGTQTVRNTLDLQAALPYCLPFHDPTTGEPRPALAGPLQAMSLESVCRQALGLRLDKLEQKSEWGERPLRPAQLEYAALDAAVLPRLYDAVKGAGPLSAAALDGHCADIEVQYHAT